MTLVRWKSALGAVVFLICVCITPQTARAVKPVMSQTFQNLSRSDSRTFGSFFSMEAETGMLRADEATTKDDPSTHWQIQRQYWNKRNYRTHYIRCRGDSPYNGYYLYIDPETGQLGLTRWAMRHDDTTQWVIRYAGKHGGYDAYHVQNLGRAKGRGMSYLAIDEATGEIMLSKSRIASANWHMRGAPSLPTEVLR